jgi:hypothetical protein
VLVEGTHHWRVDPTAVAALLDRFRRAEYFKLEGYYELPVTDLPTYITSLSIGKQRKFVLDYGGGGFGEASARTSFGGEDPHMPQVVAELEAAIDQVSGVLSWVKGDDNTMSYLRAAGWNFASAEAGGAMSSTLAENCNTQLARQFIRAGTS